MKMVRWEGLACWMTPIQRLCCQKVNVLMIWRSRFPQEHGTALNGKRIPCSAQLETDIYAIRLFLEWFRKLLIIDVRSLCENPDTSPSCKYGRRDRRGLLKKSSTIALLNISELSENDKARSFLHWPCMLDDTNSETMYPEMSMPLSERFPILFPLPHINPVWVVHETEYQNL